ncbi:MAG TPA: histidine phosphatase family protein [Actinomycetota bacterium]|nr:histidine phosphatase family protein [Actinomycetota bacterium]
MTLVFLVRHGATDWNLHKRAQGQADIPLSEPGRLQALDAAKQLATFDIQAVFSSDLQRAADTAMPIAHVHGVEVVTDPDFREIDQGEWTGLPVEEIARKWPDLWGAARHYNARPGGESPQQVRTRALAGLRRAIQANPEGAIAVVSHGGTIRWLCAEALGYDDLGSARLRGVGNGGIVLIKAEIEDGKLILWGLERLDGATPDLDDPND